MKLSIPVLIVVLCVSVLACKKEVPMFAGAKSTAYIGDIYYTGSPCVGGKISFTCVTSGAKTYYWDFGDGTFSTEELPSHTYTSAGPHTVKLTLDANPAKTASKSITIYPVPTLTATLDGMITWRCVSRTYQGGRDTTYPPSIQSFPITYIDPATIIINSDTLRFESSSDDGTRFIIRFRWNKPYKAYGGGSEKELTLSHTATTDSIHYTVSYTRSISSSDYVTYDAP